MIPHVKLVLFLLPLVLLSCGSNKPFYGNQPENSALEQATNKVERYQFEKSFWLCDKPYAALTQDEADNLYKNREIRINSYGNREPADWNVVFYEGARQCVEDRLGIEIMSSYHHTNANEESPFDNVIGFNDTSVIVVQDGFFFLFTSGMSTGAVAKKTDLSQSVERNTNAQLANQYEKSETIRTPFEFSYDLVTEWKGFSQFESALFSKQLPHLSDFQSARLPAFGQVGLLLVSGVMDSGQHELYLYSLNDAYRVVDQIQLYSFRETEDGGVVTEFEISEGFVITIKKREISNKHSTLLQSQRYSIQQDGKFSLYQ
ncbi:MAG: hypothetical protein WBD34_00315 [Burkholderiaceae bacterium]